MVDETEKPSQASQDASEPTAAGATGLQAPEISSVSSIQPVFTANVTMPPRFAVPIRQDLPGWPQSNSAYSAVSSPSAYTFQRPDLGPSTSHPPTYGQLQQFPNGQPTFHHGPPRPTMFPASGATGYGGFAGTSFNYPSGVPHHGGPRAINGSFPTASYSAAGYSTASPSRSSANTSKSSGFADFRDTSGGSSSGSTTSSRGKSTGRGSVRGRGTGSRGGSSSVAKDAKTNAKWDQECLDVLVEWLTEDENYDRYRGSGDVNAGLTKLVKLEVVVSRLREKGIYHKDKHGVKKKIEELERSFRKASDWINNTGQGVMLQDGHCEVQVREYYELEAVMNSRPTSTALLTNEDETTFNVDSDTNEAQDPPSTDEDDDDFDLRDPELLLAASMSSGVGGSSKTSASRKVQGGDTKGKGKGKVVVAVEDLTVDVKGKGKEAAVMVTEKGKDSGTSYAGEEQRSGGERLELEKKRQEREWLMEAVREERAAKREHLESQREERAAERERLESQRLQIEIQRHEEEENSRQAMLSMEVESKRLDLQEQRVEHRLRMIKKRRELEDLGLSSSEIDEIMRSDE
ncbi:hypothetical protein BC829DRAFT_442708 [Chytridium lagenaria]|nr:hypothetical protein BC829DRAFT_442708 [Chytridium lagenaria]